MLRHLCKSADGWPWSGVCDTLSPLDPSGVKSPRGAQGGLMMTGLDLCPVDIWIPTALSKPLSLTTCFGAKTESHLAGSDGKTDETSTLLSLSELYCRRGPVCRTANGEPPTRPLRGNIHCIYSNNFIDHQRPSQTKGITLTWIQTASVHVTSRLEIHQYMKYIKIRR